jgi:hypothetical protein
MAACENAHGVGGEGYFWAVDGNFTAGVDGARAAFRSHRDRWTTAMSELMPEDRPWRRVEDAVRVILLLTSWIVWIVLVVILIDEALR